MLGNLVENIFLLYLKSFLFPKFLLLPFLKFKCFLFISDPEVYHCLILVFCLSLLHSLLFFLDASKHSLVVDFLLTL